MHALNRLTFGPRPGDVQQVMAIGVERWIDLQLHPEKIDDSALDARLEPLRTLRMSTREIAEDFPDGQEINQVQEWQKTYAVGSGAARGVSGAARPPGREKRTQGRGSQECGCRCCSGQTNGASMDGSMMAAKRDARCNELCRRQQRFCGGHEERPASSGHDGSRRVEPPTKPTPEEEEQARLREERLYSDLEVQQLPSLPPDERFKKILSMTPEAQLAVADSLRGGKGKEFLEGLTPKQKETLLAMNNPGGVVNDELAQAKFLRAVYSQRQLEEVMTDFWFNHFNVFVDKGLDRLMLTSYERDVIRPHALGKFEDLLVATAKSPAMLFYLDNWLSVGPDSDAGAGNSGASWAVWASCSRGGASARAG